MAALSILTTAAPTKICCTSRRCPESSPQSAVVQPQTARAIQVQGQGHGRARLCVLAWTRAEKLIAMVAPFAAYLGDSGAVMLERVKAAAL